MIQRYNIYASQEYGEFYLNVDPDDRGMYCKSADVAALEAENKKLKEERDDVRREACGHVAVLCMRDHPTDLLSIIGDRVSLLEEDE